MFFICKFSNLKNIFNDIHGLKIYKKFYLFHFWYWNEKNTTIQQSY